MGLQDNRILSPFLAIWVVFLFFAFKSFGLGRAFFLFFSVLIFLFFLQSSAANIICTNWSSETKKKT